ncbi:MAG: BON domain-containing protein [Verrucomicrobia bacterium]|nr:BON domain-containing protein [Verrucomicrobiota bacterium]
MKALFLLLLGFVIGVFSYHLYLTRNDASATHLQGATLAERSKEAATEAKDTVSNKLVEWKLTPTDIRQDLTTAGKVVRTKAKVAGDRISDARIVAVIKGKYAFESDISAFAINVDCTDGHVTLRGTVSSLELVGKAVRLALETDGVTEVDAQLSSTSAP